METQKLIGFREKTDMIDCLTRFQFASLESTLLYKIPIHQSSSLWNTPRFNVEGSYRLLGSRRRISKRTRKRIDRKSFMQLGKQFVPPSTFSSFL